MLLITIRDCRRQLLRALIPRSFSPCAALDVAAADIAVSFFDMPPMILLLSPIIARFFRRCRSVFDAAAAHACHSLRHMRR